LGGRRIVAKHPVWYLNLMAQPDVVIEEVVERHIGQMPERQWLTPALPNVAAGLQ
jgi:hypothetical protein